MSRRRDAGALQITDRDIAVLTWIAQQYCMSYDQLHRLLAHFGDSPRNDAEKVAYSTTLNAVQRWLQLGLIDTPQKILRGHTTHVWLSRKGLHQLGLPYSYYFPKPSSIPHFYAVNAVRFHLQRFNLSALWESERTLKLQSNRQPLPATTERRTLPDAELHVSKVPIIAVQILERQRLANVTLQEEITTLQVLAQRYTRIWYFIHANSTDLLQNAIHEHDTKVAPDKQVATRLVWYSLDAKEINHQQRQEPA